MRGNVIRTVLFCGGKPENVIVFVDRSPYCTQRVMAVGQRIRYGKTGKTARFRRLNDAHISNIVRGDRVKPKFQLFSVARIVRAQNFAAHRRADCFFLFIGSHKRAVFAHEFSFYIINALLNQLNHTSSSEDVICLIISFFCVFFKQTKAHLRKSREIIFPVPQTS